MSKQGTAGERKHGNM